MAAKSYAPLSILVLLIAFIYARWSILPTFYLNAPGRLTPINAVNSEGSYEVRFKHFIRNCEDIHLNEEEGWILLSCDPGRDKWNTVLVSKWWCIERRRTPYHAGHVLLGGFWIYAEVCACREFWRTRLLTPMREFTCGRTEKLLKVVRSNCNWTPCTRAQMPFIHWE